VFGERKYEHKSNGEGRRIGGREGGGEGIKRKDLKMLTLQNLHCQHSVFYRRVLLSRATLIFIYLNYKNYVFRC
jgi:hypothetical protein